MLCRRIARFGGAEDRLLRRRSTSFGARGVGIGLGCMVNGMLPTAFSRSTISHPLHHHVKECVPIAATSVLPR